MCAVPRFDNTTVATETGSWVTPVPQCDYPGGEVLLVIVEVWTSQTKVRKLERAFVVDEQVCSFKVAVQYSLTMAIG